MLEPTNPAAVLPSSEKIALRQLLAHIAVELEFIAQQNDQIQETLQQVLQNIRLRTSDIESLQTLDLLSQKKRDLGNLLSILATKISDNESVPLSQILQGLKLEYLKTVLITGSDTQPAKEESGAVKFF